VAVVTLSLHALRAPQPAVAQGIGQQFTGSSRSQSGFIPPDTMGAVGPTHFIELINGRYAVYPKVAINNPNGTRTPLFASTLNAFWANAGAPHAGAFAFDPRIVYDASSQRFFAGAVDNQRGNNSFMVAVSRTSNPLDGWSAFKVDSDTQNLRWADFPTLGFNADGVFLAANMFPQTGQNVGQQTTLLAVPKADLLAPAPTIANARLLENVASTTGFNSQPLVNLDNTGGTAPFIAFAGFLRRSDIVGPIGSGPLVNVITTLASGDNPLEAPQPGPKQDIFTLDNRISGNAILQEGTIWGVQTILQPGGRSGLHWFKLRASDNAVLQDGVIADPDLHFYYGSIGVNEFGDVVIAASGSSENQFVSSYGFVGDSAGNTVFGNTTFGGPILLKAGVDDYEALDGAGRNRWGDYSATMVDPSDPLSFWTIQEFVSADNQYSLQVTQILIPEPAMLGAACVLIALIRRRRCCC
jgi:hypothetical protein